MASTRTLPARLSLVVAAVVLAVLPACSSGDDAATSDDAGAADGATSVADVAPDLELVEVGSGETTTLDEALQTDGDMPVLAWFWAPHCPTCRGEAPELDAFIADNADAVSMVGIGTRDDYDLAQGFLDDTGVQNFPLYWEETGEGWAAFDVTAQPYLILIDDGQVVERWPGGATPQEISARLAKLS